jgi:hypothetical protein
VLRLVLPWASLSRAVSRTITAIADKIAKVNSDKNHLQSLSLDLSIVRVYFDRSVTVVIPLRRCYDPYLKAPSYRA